MKIYGQGVFKMPYSARVIWDFLDGPFDTTNQTYLAEAKRLGLSFTPPVEKAKTEKKAEPKDTQLKRGRKPKGAENVNSKTNRTD